MLEVQGVATDSNDVFPYSGLRVLGLIQLVNGVIVFLIGVIDLSITMASYDDDDKRLDSRYDDIVTLTVASAPLWCGMWFALTGSMGMCFTRARSHTLRIFKMAFLVLNILCAVLFGPACAVVCGLISMKRHKLDSDDVQWLATLLLCFLGVMEILFAAGTSFVACCCSPLRGTQVHILLNDGTLKRKIHPHAESDETTKDKHMANNDSFHYDEFQATSVSSKVYPRAEIDEPKYHNDMPGARPGRPLPVERPQHLEEPQHKYDGFGDSQSNTESYSKLKKWALPKW